jgi:hypothetical protein
MPYKSYNVHQIKQAQICAESCDYTVYQLAKEEEVNFPSLGCIHFVAFTLLHSLGFIHLCVFTWFHSL